VAGTQGRDERKRDERMNNVNNIVYLVGAKEKLSSDMNR
jgi:hypothetical protein